MLFDNNYSIYDVMKNVLALVYEFKVHQKMLTVLHFITIVHIFDWYSNSQPFPSRDHSTKYFDF